MSGYSPALTWMHLFPEKVSWECDSAPPAMMQLLGAKSKSARRALAAWEHAMPDAAQLHELFGFAGVNCRGATEASMRAAGFQWVQRFAVLPSLQNARWFIPLDSPAVAAAAFSLFTPTRFSARVKLFAARMATRTGLPWYRDEICLAQRTPPGLQVKAHALFPNHQVRLAFSAGAPEPARNRKPSFVVLDVTGEILAFGKVAASELSHRLMQHEAEMLEALRTRVAGLTPRLIFAGDVDGTFVTLQRPLPGRAPAAELTIAHGRLLEALRVGPTKPATELGMVGALETRIDALPAPHPELSKALHQIIPTLRATSVPSTIIHGDFAPWNLREEAGEVRAFDWEYGEVDGLPLVDELHFMLQTGFQLRRWNIERAHAALQKFASSSPLGLAPKQVVAIQITYLLDNLIRLYAEGYGEDNDIVGWYGNLLALLTRGLGAG